MDAEITTVKCRPSLASAKKPLRRSSKLKAPTKLVTIVADFAVEICNSPTKYVTKFIDMPITHILSESSDLAPKFPFILAKRKFWIKINYTNS